MIGFRKLKNDLNLNSFFESFKDEFNYLNSFYENKIKDLTKFKKMSDEDLQMYEKHLENVYKKCKHSDDASEKKNKETPLVNKISQ